MSVFDHLAHARFEFRIFRIPHPRLLRILEEITILRDVGRRAREEWLARGRQGPRRPQKFLPIIGPTGMGKSTCILHYRETVLAAERHDPEIHPFVHVTLNAQATIKRLGSDILSAYEDPDFEEGTASKLLRRAADHIDAARTETLALDEIHHLINNDGSMSAHGGGKTAWSVTETIKRMLIEGTCPLILIGTEHAEPLLMKNPQLKGRSYTPIFLSPLDASIREEKDMFIEYCAGFDLKLVEHRIFERLSGLITGDIPGCMYDVSGGVFGTASSVFEVAAEIAIRRGGDGITREDLSNAVRTWAIPLKYTDYNPFEGGPRRLRPGKAA
ncbi:TniB protein [Azospirillum baldaniorum]|uniref:ATP-binding protein n=1 Tax=Azospirillum baldaniorum TaxID=1064539 RepID=UPI0011A1B6FE|nr:ATP-binding protein [Azospirillum baldaniorum]TWA60434.1 TniB protein [Azospirillum baldaniorum]